jgi:23S rRNA pseudoU1915 N3-methylase RlmH
LKLFLLYIGKPRNREANLLAQEYARRLEHYCRFQMIQIKDETAAGRYETALKVVLDPAGKQITSGELASFLEKSQRDVAFFVGEQIYRAFTILRNHPYPR